LGTRETSIVHMKGNNAPRSQTGNEKKVCVTRLGQQENINAATVTFMGIHTGWRFDSSPRHPVKRRVLRLSKS